MELQPEHLKKYKIPAGQGPIRKSMSKKKMSPIQLKIYELCADPINGSLFFAENCCWVRRGQIEQYHPFDYQREALFNLNSFQRICLLAARQLGKTITTSIYALWLVTFFNAKDVVLTSYSDAAAKEILAGIKLLYDFCPNFLKRGIVKYNEKELWFDNKSRIFSRTSTIRSARGTSPSLIIADEMAFVGQGESSAKMAEKQQEFYAALSPALSASMGKLSVTSTPMSETDVFYRIWSGAIKKTDEKGLKLPSKFILKINGELYQDFHCFNTREEAEEYIKSIGSPSNYEVFERDGVGENGYSSQLVTWDKCPLKTQEWADRELIDIGEARFRREYCCLIGDTILRIMDERNNTFDISMEMLYNTI